MLARCGYCDIESKFMDGIVLVLSMGTSKQSLHCRQVYATLFSNL